MGQHGATVMVALASGSRWAALCAVVATCACSSAEDEIGATSNNGGNGSAQDGGSGAGDAAASNEWVPTWDAAIFGDGAPWQHPSRVSLTQQVRAINADADGAPTGGAALGGVEVCIYELPDYPCATTDSEGWYELRGLPKQAKLTITMTKDGYVPVVKPLLTGTGDLVSDGLTYATLFATELVSRITPPGLEWTPGTGVISFAAFGDAGPDEAFQFAPKPGVTVTLNPTHGSRPYYYDASFVPNPSASSTTDGGTGFVWNLPEGGYTVTFSHPDQSCELGWSRGAPTQVVSTGFQTNDVETIGVPVLADHWTMFAQVYCVTDHPAPDAGIAP